MKFFIPSDNPLIQPLPLFNDKVRAGFPSPAQDYIEQTLDLNELCITHPASTYFVRADGYSMINAGIHPGDILVVDRSLEAVHQDIVIAAIDGEFTVKLLSLHPTIQLQPMNEEFLPIDITAEDDLILFGVVTFVIHKTRTR
ncbi:translesion error-prone DNA polymerase V autoproteolytic subunit [Zophobihabitans entericus]|uniref:Translesion error-prone DNA polymerase V autoproteolytic subunit n=1 Tax=Zophobihabitans entericus TaxID=1635327 RepID=A0A6G9IB75_9GAMM|nr:translesion error-prone DNA polymerase V autoproteolytic subunit [Zophobihabitans entericus]QIQ21473.1 translesion error-prone DNA polymerase V autoproteolytic subunit [Zophobihabitans entericus]